MIVKRFGCTTIHNKALYKCFIHSFIHIKIWHAASNNGINMFKIIVINNRNYNLKGIIDNYDFCHNRAALFHRYIILPYSTVGKLQYFCPNLHTCKQGLKLTFCHICHFNHDTNNIFW